MASRALIPRLSSTCTSCVRSARTHRPAVVLLDLGLPPNPGTPEEGLAALSEILAGLHEASGRVAIPGFYDRVRRWSAAERAYMASVGPSDAEILRDAQAEAGWGEPGYTPYERTTIRPALTFGDAAGPMTKSGSFQLA